MHSKAARILLFSSFPERGRGGQESLYHLAISMDPNRFRPIVLVPSEGSLARSLRERGCDVRIVDLPRVMTAGPRRLCAAVARLGSIVDELGIDILHTDGPRNTFYAGIVGRWKHRPVVWHVRASSRDSSDPFLSGLCSRLILVAEALAARFPSARSRRKIRVIPNGVDLNRFRPGAPPGRTGGGEVVIGTVGRVEPQKGILELLRAVHRVNGDEPSVRLRVAGPITDIEYFDRCREYCRAAGIGDRVEFLGPVHPVEEFLQTVDVFTLCSIEAEAFPRAVLEAMACAKPVVATSTGGTREALEEGCTGYVVSPKSPEALVGRLRILLRDPGLRARMGAAGRKRAEALYALPRSTERTLRVYGEVMECA